ncbi:MAG: COG1361 S-layer family protein [Candidatus Nanohalobium sp.]
MKRLATITALLIIFSSFVAAGPSIKVQKMSTEPAPLKVGQSADVQFKVVNTGDGDVKNVSVRFKENYPFSVDPDTTKSWRIASLDSGDTYQFRTQVRVDPSALQGDEKLEFVTSTSDSTSRTHLLPVHIKADDDGLAISNVEFPGQVVSGTSREMNLTLENTANAYFRNIELSLNPAAQTPIVTSGTSTRRVGKIAPDEKKTISFRLNVGQSAENGVYSIPLNLKYDNEAGATITKQQSTGIVVGGRPQIELGVNDGNIDAGTKGSLTLRFVNRGEGTAKFVKIKAKEADGYRILSGNSVYLGDMNPDDYQTSELQVYANKSADAAKVPVEITYQVNGKEKTVTRKADVNILTPSEKKLYGMTGGGSPLPIAVVAILIIGGAVYYWRRRKRR